MAVRDEANGTMTVEGADATAEESYARAVMDDLRDHLPRLFAANLLLIAFALPALALALVLVSLPLLAALVAIPMVGPAWCALLACTRPHHATRDSRPFGVIWYTALRRTFRRGCALAGLAVGVGIALWVALSVQVGSGALQATYWIVALVTCALGILLLLAASALIARYDTSVRDALRNAAILVLGHPGAFLALAVFGGTLGWLVVQFSFGPLVIAPALFAVCLSRTLDDLVARHRASP